MGFSPGEPGCSLDASFGDTASNSESGYTNIQARTENGVLIAGRGIALCTATHSQAVAGDLLTVHDIILSQPFHVQFHLFGELEKCLPTQGRLEVQVEQVCVF